MYKIRSYTILGHMDLFGVRKTIDISFRKVFEIFLLLWRDAELAVGLYTQSTMPYTRALNPGLCPTGRWRHLEDYSSIK